MGSDYVMLDTWRKTFFDAKNQEYVLVQNKRVFVESLVNFVRVQNSDFKTAIAVYLKEVVLNGTAKPY